MFDPSWNSAMHQVAKGERIIAIKKRIGQINLELIVPDRLGSRHVSIARCLHAERANLKNELTELEKSNA